MVPYRSLYYKHLKLSEINLSTDTSVVAFGDGGCHTKLLVM